MYSNYLSFFCIFFLIFVPWKKGPESWKRISPKIFYVVLLLNYIFIPALNMLMSFVTWVDPNIDLHAQIAETYMVFYFFVCATRILEYFTTIKRTVLIDAREHISIMSTIGDYKDMNEEELKKEYD